MNKLILTLMFLTSITYASGPLWYAHPQKKETEEQMLKRNLSFILTHSRSAAGLAYIFLQDDERFYTYQGLDKIPDYKNRIGASYFRDFKSFDDKMQNMAHEVPSGKFIFNASVNSLIKTSYFFKRMKEDISMKKFENFEQSFNGVQIADYRKNTQRYHDMALQLCTGDISRLGLFINTIPKQWINLTTLFLTGKDCRETVKRDILDLINPYDNPIATTADHSVLEGTSIFLASKLIPNTNYENNTLYRSLLKIKKISSISPSYNLFDALKESLKISSLDTIRLINLANHNHGLEFFVLNGILDLTHNENKIITNTKAVYSAINHLYKLINQHDKDRKNYSSAKEDQLERKYHFWGGAFVTCELMHIGYNKFLATFISKKLGENYETSTSGSSASEKREMNNDILLHHLGAQYAQSICR